jgi:macrolide phosphotransferase
VTRTPLALAALASAAVPGLDPAAVEGVRQPGGRRFEVAFIHDTQHRRWVVRAPVSAAAGAQMDVSVSLLELLARRLPFSVPTPKGFVALKEGGRAVVYPQIAGRPLDFQHLPGGPGIAAEVGRALAALHNVDLALCDEAGLPSYDPDTYRTRRLSDLDRAATTGQVPTGLLSRWERSLEDVSLWRFAPTPTHGDLTGDEVLAVFDDEEDAATGRIRGVTGWENAKVADPADDFATLVTQASAPAMDSVLEAYAHARVDRPDKYLTRRARLAGELKLVSGLLRAVGSKDHSAVKAFATKLRRLDAQTLDHEPDDDEPVVPTAPSVHEVPAAAQTDHHATDHHATEQHATEQHATEHHATEHHATEHHATEHDGQSAR